MTVRDSLARRRPMKNIPEAIEAALQHRINTAVRVDRRDGEPTEQWWAGLRDEVARACATWLAEHEPDSRVSVGERGFDGVAYTRGARTSALSIEIVPRRALELRVYLLTWQDHGLVLTPFSHYAKVEAGVPV